MYRVFGFAFLAAAVGACGETASTSDRQDNAAEFAADASQNEQTVMAEEEAKSAGQPAMRARPSPAQPGPGKKSDRPADKEIKPSPLDAPAEIDPVPPPVEDAQPQQD